MNSGLYNVTDQENWMRIIDSMPEYDVYFLPEYHETVREEDEEAFLFWYERGGNTAALPFLRRPVTGVPGLEGEEGFDGVTTYGYTGAIVNSRDAVKNPEFIKGFQAELRRCLREQNLVSLFCRQHPVLGCEALFDGLGEIEERGRTVVIGLSEPPDTQWTGISKGHRYDIRKAARMEVAVRETGKGTDLEKFIEIYNETMLEIGARRSYFFSRSYYDKLFGSLGERVRLFVAEVDGTIVSAALFFFQHPFIQYHLSGTPRKHLKYLGAKVILNEVRQIGTREGYRWLHLGGGVGGAEDALFRFKAGFSRTRLPFKTVKIISDGERYQELVEIRHRSLGETSASLTDSGFFPAYRASSEE